MDNNKGLYWPVTGEGAGVIFAEQFVEHRRPWPDGVGYLAATGQYFLDGPLGHRRWLQPGDWIVVDIASARYGSPLVRRVVPSGIFRLLYATMEEAGDPSHQRATIGAMRNVIATLRDENARLRAERDEARTRLAAEYMDSLLPFYR